MIDHARCPISLILTAAITLSSSHMRAQNFPGKVHIFNAAQQMNSINATTGWQATIATGIA